MIFWQNDGIKVVFYILSSFNMPVKLTAACIKNYKKCNKFLFGFSGDTKSIDSLSRLKDNQKLS